MLSMTVVAVIILTERAQAGYIYPRPNIVFELPKDELNFQEGFTQKTKQENVPRQTHETVVSYSVPFEDYYYLHQNKIGQQQRPNLVTSMRTIHNAGASSVGVSAVNTLTNALVQNIPPVYTVGNLPIGAPAPMQTLTIPAPLIHQSHLGVNSLQYMNSPTVNVPAVKLSALIKEQSNVPVNTAQHIINIPSVKAPSVNIPVPTSQQSNFAVNTFPHISTLTDNTPTVNSPIQLNQQSKLVLSPVHQTDIPPVNIASVNLPAQIHQQSNSNFNTEQNVINHDVNSDLNGPLTVQNVVSPKITKHIYFHVPPPEIEEPVLTPIVPKKKIYKIIFIKVPSQETKRIAQLQQLANQVAPIEDKTIIYVLSKKPEPQQVFLPKPTPSEHEVLFVKYSGSDPDTAATLASGNLEQPDSALLPTTVTPRLQSGVINVKR